MPCLDYLENIQCQTECECELIDNKLIVTGITKDKFITNSTII